MVASTIGIGRQLSQRVTLLFTETGSLPLDPALEFRRVRQVESVEERASVKGRSAAKITLRDARFKFRHIAAEGVGAHAKLRGTKRQIIQSEISTKC